MVSKLSESVKAFGTAVTEWNIHASLWGWRYPGLIGPCISERMTRRTNDQLVIRYIVTWPGSMITGRRKSEIRKCEGPGTYHPRLFRLLFDLGGCEKG